MVIHSQYESYIYFSTIVGFHYDEGKITKDLNLVFSPFSTLSTFSLYPNSTILIVGTMATKIHYKIR